LNLEEAREEYSKIDRAFTCTCLELARAVVLLHEGSSKLLRSCWEGNDELASGYVKLLRETFKVFDKSLAWFKLQVNTIEEALKKRGSESGSRTLSLI